MHALLLHVMGSERLPQRAHARTLEDLIPESVDALASELIRQSEHNSLPSHL